MTPKCHCGSCDRDVPANVDGTPKRHTRPVNLGGYPVSGGLLSATRYEPCPDGSNLYPILMTDPMALALRLGLKRSTLRESDRWKDARKGDRLYVKETWGVGTRPHPDHGWVDGYEYRADCGGLGENDAPPLYRASSDLPDSELSGAGWQNSMFAPFRSTRTILRLVEDPHLIRPQDLTLDQIMMEGVEVLTRPEFRAPEKGRKWWVAAQRAACVDNWRGAFMALWIAINGTDSWDANAPVWRLVFEVSDVG